MELIKVFEHFCGYTDNKIFPFSNVYSLRKFLRRLIFFANSLDVEENLIVKNCVSCRYKKTRSYIFLLQLVIVKSVFLLCSYKFLITQLRQRNTISYLHVWLSVLTKLLHFPITLGSSFFFSYYKYNCSSSLMLASFFLIHVNNSLFIGIPLSLYSSDALKTDNQQFRFWAKGANKNMCTHYQCLQN